MKTKTKKKRSKPSILFTRAMRDFVNGRNVIVYYAGVREGTPANDFKDEVLVRISKEQYDRINRAVERAKFNTQRKQGGKRGKGEAPGAGHCWPMSCEALAVHPRQVEQMNARNKRHGINVQYEPKHGLAQIPDEGEYKKLRKLEGAHHNNSYN